MRRKIFKPIVLLLVAIMLLSLGTACGKTDTEKGDKAGDGESLPVEDASKDDKSDDDGQVSAEDENTGEEGAFPIEVTDILGRKVTIEKEPEKVASVAPNSTETLFALGLGDKVIGVSKQCDYPEEALDKDKLGDFWEPNVELIVAAAPDILFVGNKAPEDFIAKIEENGIKVLAFEGYNLEDTYECIINTGKVMGAQGVASDLVDSMKDKVDEIQEKVASADKPKTYFVISYGEMGDFTAGSGSFIDEMINLAGGENVAGDMEEEWAEYSIEKLVEKAPEIIMTTPQAIPEGLKEAPGYKELEAIKEDKIVVLDDNLVMRSGPRIVEGLEEMAKGLHPDFFK